MTLNEWKGFATAALLEQSDKVGCDGYTILSEPGLCEEYAHSVVLQLEAVTQAPRRGPGGSTEHAPADVSGLVRLSPDDRIGSISYMDRASEVEHASSSRSCLTLCRP